MKNVAELLKKLGTVVMIKNLVIVESPAKAKTIEKFLGSEYIVKSSFGHVRDLSKKNFGIDIENNYEPDYIVSDDKKKVVTELKKLAKEAEVVWLAADEDREGEAIAWHLYEVLKLKKKETKRIVFNEITKKAILKAIDSPRNINVDLVNAQQARRVLDRLVGFELSPILWKKLRKTTLSAGRVQSVAVKLIVEREREIMSFKSDSSYKVSAEFKNGLKAELNKKPGTESEVKGLLSKCLNASFKVAKVEAKPSKKSPQPPFTTSTLQQEASRRLGFSVSQTMTLAQRLYESGFITYMRTDSVNLSDEAMSKIKDAVTDTFGEDYYKSRSYKSKVKGAQEAHEAIRPTYPGKEEVADDYNQQRLYSLIYKRTMASQMSDAIIEKTTIDVSVSGVDEKFVAKGEQVKFDGYLKIYSNAASELGDKLLPNVSIGQELDVKEIFSREVFSLHPPRYTEASLVKKLEDLGIGRPSTYAPTISTIQNRGYVIKEDRDGQNREYKTFTIKDNKLSSSVATEMHGSEKAKMFPTGIGMVVSDFLEKHFDNIVNYNFTAKVEKQFDDIATGKSVWTNMIDKFYKPFHKIVEDTDNNKKEEVGEKLIGNHPETGQPVYAKIGRFGPMVQLGESISKEEEAAGKTKPTFAALRKEQFLETVTLDEALELLKDGSNGRYLGDDPVSGKPIFVRYARYGSIAQLGKNEDEEKPTYASLMKGQTVENITFEQALKLFELPRTIGEYESDELVVAVGRFGPYVRNNGNFYALKKTDDPMTINSERAIELIEEKKEKDRKNLITQFNDDLKVSIGRWKRPYVVYKKKNYPISTKVKDPSKLTEEDCMKIIEEEKEKKKAARKSKKS